MSTRRRLADRLAVVALPLAAVAAAAGLLVTGLYRDPPEGIRQARATDLVTLVAAVPILAVSLWRQRSGSAEVVLDGRVRQAEPVRGLLLGPGTDHRGHDDDLSICGASGGAAGCHASRLAAASHSSRPSIGSS